MSQIVISGSFDDLRSRQMRILQEASRMGPVTVLLWTDAAVQQLDGKAPNFPLIERQYFVEAIRYVNQVVPYDGLAGRDALPDEYASEGGIWVVEDQEDNQDKRAFCETHNLSLRPLMEEELRGYPDPISEDFTHKLSENKRVIVTGCYDWFHSGHVRFFEEISELGDLFVVVGHDANIRLLKGDGHPMYSEDERKYMAGSIRFVKQAYVASGDGWLDAQPEIESIKPDRYAVNEDGDRPEKRDYCEANGIEYCVLKRTPREGLPRRASTDLRGF